MAVTVGQTNWQMQALVKCLPLGSCIPQGGYLVYRGPLNKCGNFNCGGYIIAPFCSQVSRTWNNQQDAVTMAICCTNSIPSISSGSWFVPSINDELFYQPRCIYWDCIAATPGGANVGTADSITYWTCDAPTTPYYAHNFLTNNNLTSCPASCIFNIRAARLVLY